MRDQPTHTRRESTEKAWRLVVPSHPRPWSEADQVEVKGLEVEHGRELGEHRVALGPNHLRGRRWSGASRWSLRRLSDMPA